jgi:TPR repeat protein
MGDGIEKDYQQAAFWFGKSAEKGNAMAQERLGYLYMAGLGMDKDKVKAYAWLKMATDGKYSQATDELKSVEKELTPEQKTQGDALYKDLSEKQKALPPEEDIE